MAMTFTLSFKSPDDSAATISVEAGAFSTTWKAAREADFGVTGGVVANWGSGAALLTAAAGVEIVLDGFKSTVKVGDTGSGAKNYDDGNFPGGDFEWTCADKVRRQTKSKTKR